MVNVFSRIDVTVVFTDDISQPEPQEHTHTGSWKWAWCEKTPRCQSNPAVFYLQTAGHSECVIADHICLGDEASQWRENTSHRVTRKLSLAIHDREDKQKQAEECVFKSVFLILTRKTIVAHFLHLSLHKKSSSHKKLLFTSKHTL